MGAYRLLRKVWPYVGSVVSVLALGRVFDLTVGDVLVWSEALLPFVTGAKIGWFLFAVASGFFAYVELRHRHVPLTLLETNTCVRIESPNGDRVKVIRQQKLRANHDNVTGYHRKIFTSGSMPLDELSFNIGHCKANKQKLEVDGTPQNWEVIHRFDPIPLNPFVLGLNTVQRTETIAIYDGFTSVDESYEIYIPSMYRHVKMTFKVQFHPECGCDAKDCEALWISALGVVELPLEVVPPASIGDGHAVMLNIKRPRAGDRYRIKWKNKNGKQKSASSSDEVVNIP